MLIIGNGAREHALAWKLAQSPDIESILVAPGNPGTQAVATNVSVSATDVPGLLRLVQDSEVDLTVVGPEASLGTGLPDILRARGDRVVGPSAAGFRLESSKLYAKTLMARAGVPTADYETFDDYKRAVDYLHTIQFPVVLKADGLAAGKGVVICENRDHGLAVLADMMLEQQFGEAGRTVVIEEVLEGTELSLMAFVDGDRVVTLPPAQDHKRLGDNDRGPNTGGMGAYSPVPMDPDYGAAAMAKAVIEPIVATLREMGVSYRGIIFAGLMLTNQGPMVLEYNCRLGDPETQAILPILDEDLLPWLDSVADGELPPTTLGTSGAAVAVVLAAAGYPERPRAGDVIQGVRDLAPGTLAFHAGTAISENRDLLTAGGRVMTVVGRGDNLEDALRSAYAAPIRFEGMQRRSDIGQAAFRQRPLHGIRKQSMLSTVSGDQPQAITEIGAGAHG